MFVKKNPEKKKKKKKKPLRAKLLYRIFIIFKFSKIKMQKQNHNSFHKVCVNIIIHYIFSNFNKTYLGL